MPHLPDRVGEWGNEVTETFKHQFLLQLFWLEIFLKCVSSFLSDTL